jgi:hypothetical protein
MSRRDRRADMRRAKRRNTSSTQKASSFSRGKKIIAGVATAAVLAAGAYAAMTYDTTPDSTGIEESLGESVDDLTYPNVVANNVSAADYINHINETMPEIQKAKSERLLNGIYFNPSDSELEEILSHHLTTRGFETGTESFQTVIDDLTIGYKNNKDNIFTLSSVPRGDGNATSIFVKPSFFSEEAIETEEDSRNVVRHELKHVDDSYDGVSHDGQTLDESRLGKNFRINYYELRATIAEIDYILTHPERKFSGNYRLQIAANFIRHRDNLCPENEYENAVMRRTLEQTPFSITIGKDSIILDHKHLGSHMELPYKEFILERLCIQE